MTFSGVTHDLAADGFYKSEPSDRRPSTSAGRGVLSPHLADHQDGPVWLAGSLFERFYGLLDVAAASRSTWSVVLLILAVLHGGGRSMVRAAAGRMHLGRRPAQASRSHRVVLREAAYSVGIESIR